MARLRKRSKVKRKRKLQQIELAKKDVCDVGATTTTLPLTSSRRDDVELEVEDEDEDSEGSSNETPGEKSEKHVETEATDIIDAGKSSVEDANSQEQPFNASTNQLISTEVGEITTSTPSDPIGTRYATQHPTKQWISTTPIRPPVRRPRISPHFPPPAPEPLSSPAASNSSSNNSENNINTNANDSSTTTVLRKHGARTSKYFPSPRKLTATTVKASALPFPPLSAARFGLLQEQLAPDLLHLLLGVAFLNVTAGRAAVPVVFRVLARWPTAAALAGADPAELRPMIAHLGLGARRADTCRRYGRLFAADPPRRGRRWRTPGYPEKGDGRDVGAGEAVGDEQVDGRRGAWEIAHVTRGRYALDCFRIFARDVLRGVARGWDGEGREGREEEKEAFEPEWMRVRPEDKELRAYLRWMWLKRGWVWDPVTGAKRRLGAGEVVNEEVGVVSGDSEEKVVVGEGVMAGGD